MKRKPVAPPETYAQLRARKNADFEKFLNERGLKFNEKNCLIVPDKCFKCGGEMTATEKCFNLEGVCTKCLLNIKK